ncbi:ubiquitin-conjugating enzyme [Purpureocillium lavendulum]|uniref:Ubiquitin-conjugating enzyme n=1 Tax=Purpureocillium lavendulum TaxID=1247861 RepID=A0AB34G0J5_9HYPO|nr:ubiquitin-conjugating enzyme [Purpureocillium lavendulum]
MAGKKGENSKKVAGNARKADAAAQKAAQAEAKQEAADAEKWQKGSKSNAKKEAEEAKKAEAARKKAEKDALLKEEEANTPGRAEPKKSKAPVKKSRGLDLSQLEGDGPSTALNATGIDNALDALSLTTGGDDGKVDKHPERRFAAAFAKYEERRLAEMKADGSGTGLRLDQRKQRIRKEFDKSPENPFNQVTAAYNATRGDVEQIKAHEKSKIEKRLGYAGLKQACPEGIFVTITPGDPTLWSAVLFVRDGPYAQAVLRFQISFPDTYPKLPPLILFSTDMFHPLITPLTTYMYTTDIQDNGTWFGRGRRAASATRQASGEQPRSPVSESGSKAPSTAFSPESESDGLPSYMRQSKHSTSVYHILKYIRGAFDDETVLDSVPLEAAGNPGAWHAWRTHRRRLGKLAEEPTAAASEAEKEPAPVPEAPAGEATQSVARRPGEWNWEGVWEDRVKKGIAASLSEPVLYGGSGAPDELIHFLPMEEQDVESVKENQESRQQGFDHTRNIATEMDTREDESPHVEFRLPEALQPASCKPTPLRIVKRRSDATPCTDITNENAPPETGVRLGGSSPDSLDKKSRLNAAKRHDRRPTPTISPNSISGNLEQGFRPEFWSSSVELVNTTDQERSATLAFGSGSTELSNVILPHAVWLLSSL